MTFTDDEVEELNAFGPYNHAVWRGRGATITQEESLTGRAEFLATTVRKMLLSAFSVEEIAELSIADIGCYDGWLLEQISDLPFKRIVGIEPRSRNIEKGKKVREILQIGSRVEYRVGSIEDPGDEIFDVVICTGLLHHLESIGDGLRSLRAICRRKLFIETQVLSSHHITDDFLKELEPKDVVNFGKVPLVGLSGHKFESSFYHGSAMKSAVVSVPTLPTLHMFMHHLGFRNITTLVEPSAYWDGAVKRAAKGCCVVADVGAPVEEAQADGILGYEQGLMNTRLPDSSVRVLYAALNNGTRTGLSINDRIAIAYATGPAWLSRVLLRYIKKRRSHPFEFEIIKNLRYAPLDKIALEMAKLHYANGEFSDCIAVAQRITRRVNADWRATYRAFLILSHAYRHVGDVAAAARYEELCRTSNPELPEALFAQAPTR